MPHQCLACGHLFEEGSSQILQGCPECKGTRFFYTAKAVDEGARKALADRAQKDLRQVVSDLLQDTAPETAAEIAKSADADGWASLKAKDLRRLVRQAQEEQQRAVQSAKPAGEAAWENPEVQPFVVSAGVEASRDRLAKEMEAASKAPAKPDTVNVKRPGEYEIDVKALLEQEPIVVHKDGSYLIHLPSLFDKKH